MSENNEIVDEFAGLSPAPPSRSPVLALVVIGVSLATIFHLRSDIRYAFESKSPTALDVLTGTGAPMSLATGRHVTVEGIPDRRDSLFIEARGDKNRETFFRLLGTEPPVFVRATATLGRSDLSNHWTGRLRRFSDVTFASSLREYFTKGIEVRRYLAPASLRAAVEHKAASVVDRRGRSVALSASTALEVEQASDHYVLELLREKYPTLADAQHELERVTQPLGVPVTELTQDDPEVFRFGTPLLETDLARRNQLLDALSAAEVSFGMGHHQLLAQLGTLTGGADGVTAAGKTIPWDRIETVAVREPLQVDEDALVLTEGETPSGFLWAPGVAALLLALAVWNVLYLVRPRRR